MFALLILVYVKLILIDITEVRNCRTCKSYKVMRKRRLIICETVNPFPDEVYIICTQYTAFIKQCVEIMRDYQMIEKFVIKSKYKNKFNINNNNRHVRTIAYRREYHFSTFTNNTIIPKI